VTGQRDCGGAYGTDPRRSIRYTPGQADSALSFAVITAVPLGHLRRAVITL